MDKRQLREQMKGRLFSLGAAEISARSEAACLHAANTAAFADARRILCYAAMPKEADPAALVRLARAAGKAVAFPRCLPGGEMTALAPQSEDAWEKGRYGIWEPVPARSDELTGIDLVIVPGLAFDRAGNRLGRGAGYYDRYLSRIAAVRMGFCLSFQLLSALPADPHDALMDWVATEDGILPAGRG